MTNKDIISETDFSSLTRRDFGMKHDFHYIAGRRFLDKYAGYQAAYQKQYGVLPEFDKIHNPFAAPGEAVYEFYRSAFVRGFYGAWYYHDIHGRLNKKFKTIYYQYRNEFSFVNGFAPIVFETIEKRILAGNQEHIQNKLGYKVEDGIYYEGTWNGDRLVYGMMYDKDNDLYFIGSIKYDNQIHRPLYHGIRIFVNQSNNQSVSGLNCGILYMDRTGDLLPYEGDVLTMTLSQTDFSLEICKYEEGYENGKAYRKEISHGEVTIAAAVMKDGGVKRNLLNPISKLVHWYCGFCFMTMYYILKYTYGLLIFPFYRIYRRKHWK